MSLFPGVRLLREYQPEWLRRDLVASVVLAAYLLPAGIGDASLAGLPPEAGLYSCLFAGLAFWLFCSSRHTAISVTSAISLLLGTSLADLAGGDAARYAALASTTALIVAVLGLLAWLVGAGSIVSFISETVMIGFKTGVALHLASTQLPKLFGFPGAHGDFWERMGHFFSHLGQTNPAALGLGAAALGLLLLGKWLLPNRPVALLVVVAGIAAVPTFGLAARGVALLGEVPQGRVAAAGTSARRRPGAEGSDHRALGGVEVKKGLCLRARAVSDGQQRKSGTCQPRPAAPSDQCN